jgi:hypothetical protein
MLLLSDMQTTTSRHDARYKQVYGYHIQVLHIFSNLKTYKTLFISSNQSKDMNFARFACLQEFQKNRETARDVSHPKEASQSSRRLGPRLTRTLMKQIWKQSWRQFR